MAEMLINNWGGGIGDDPFLSRTGECLDMNGIDIRTTPRKIQADGAFYGGDSPYLSNGNSDLLKHVYDSIEGPVQSYESHCFVDTIDISSIVAGADVATTLGANSGDYDSVTNPEGVRHVFFRYNGGTNPILVLKRSGGVLALHQTLATNSGVTPAIPVSYHTTAVCQLWNGVTLFARGNKIYEVLLEPTTPSLANAPKILLPIGAIVKNIYYFGGLIQIVYVIGNDTYIQGCQYNGSTYTINTYSDKTAGEKLLDSTVSNNVISWISQNGVFEFSGASQMVKRIALQSSAKVSYNQGILRIANGSDLLEYGIQKPGYGKPLTRISTGLNVEGTTPSSIITFNGSNQYYIDRKTNFYKASNTWISHPYTAGQYGWKKKGLGLKIGYTLPRSNYVSPAIQCSILVQIQTDDMYMDNTVNFLTIGEITDKTQTSFDIMPSTINKVLGDAGYSSDFGLFWLKITLKSGDANSFFGNRLFRKTPEVYDVFLTHEEILNSFK